MVAGTMLWLRSDMQGMKAELKADIKTVDDRLRLVEREVTFIKGVNLLRVLNS